MEYESVQPPPGLPLAAATEEGASTAAASYTYSRGPLAPEAFCRQPRCIRTPAAALAGLQSNSASTASGREQGGRTARGDREQEGKAKRRRGWGEEERETGWLNAIKHVVLTSFSCLLIPHYAANKPRLTFCHLQSC